MQFSISWPRLPHFNTQLKYFLLAEDMFRRCEVYSPNLIVVELWMKETNLKMIDVNMCQKLHIPPIMKCILQRNILPCYTVNEESIKHLRDYNAEAGAIPNTFISGIKLEFISH